MYNLKQYLKSIARLEVQYYEQNKLLERINQRINVLGIPRSYSIPSKPTLFSLTESIKDSFLFAVQMTGDLILLEFCLAGLSFGFSLAFGLSSFLFFWLKLALYTVAFVAAIWLVFRILRLPFLPSKYRDNKYALQNYKQRMLDYQNAVEADSIRIQKENELRNLLCAQWYKVRDDRDATKNTIDKYYSLNIIHKKYHHNMAAVVFFYEYLDLEICTELTGPNGAYVKFEEALRFWNIENKLDIIISKLDTLIQQIDYLSNMMNESNMRLGRIESQIDESINRLDRMEADKEIDRYHNECTAKNTEAMRDMMFYDFIRK